MFTALAIGQQTLEGKGERGSHFILALIQEGRREGEITGWRGALMDLIGFSLADPVPEAVRVVIEETNDPEMLHNWYRIAVTCTTLEEFCAAAALPQYVRGASAPGVSGGRSPR